MGMFVQTNKYIIEKKTDEDIRFWIRSEDYMNFETILLKINWVNLRQIWTIKKVWGEKFREKNTSLYAAMPVLVG